MPSLLQRLRERKLVQWSLAYLAGAWLVFQGIEVLAEPWHLSEAIQRTLHVLLAIGFLTTIVIAWYHGEKGRQRVGGIKLLFVGVSRTRPLLRQPALLSEILAGAENRPRVRCHGHRRSDSSAYVDEGFPWPSVPVGLLTVHTIEETRNMAQKPGSTWRRSFNRYAPLAAIIIGTILILSSLAVVAPQTDIYARVIIGIVLVLAGGVYAQRPFLTSERTNTALRNEVENFIELVRKLNRTAVGIGGGPEFDEVGAEMRRSLERIEELAGKDA